MPTQLSQTPLCTFLHNHPILSSVSFRSLKLFMYGVRLSVEGNMALINTLPLAIDDEIAYKIEDEVLPPPPYFHCSNKNYGTKRRRIDDVNN